MSLPSSLLRSVLIVAGIAATADSAGTAVAKTHSGNSAKPEESSARVAWVSEIAAFRYPVLIAFDGNPNALVYWPIAPDGGRNPKQLPSQPGHNVGGSLAADGQQLVIATATDVLEYDLGTHAERHLPNPYGAAMDVAIGKDESIYVIDYSAKSNHGNLVKYDAGSRTPHVFSCAAIGFPQQLAVDNEGNAFVDQTGSFGGVVEFVKRGAGYAPCSVPALKPTSGPVGGVAIDPKTDDLLVADNPSYCEGGFNSGRVTTYPRPYRASTGHSHVMGRQCTSAIKLNADSKLLFVSDTASNSSTSIILQRRYPGGEPLGEYDGTSPGSFTTIPNSLPN